MLFVNSDNWFSVSKVNVTVGSRKKHVQRVISCKSNWFYSLMTGHVHIA